MIRITGHACGQPAPGRRAVGSRLVVWQASRHALSPAGFGA